jgi:HD-GYP domain-containing protein (c-di-GMP phosphodiesterase class II)
MTPTLPHYRNVTPVALISMLSARLAAHDAATEAHCHRVAVPAVAVGRELGLPTSLLVALARAALVHDIGKLAIATALLRKPGPLTAQEYEQVQDHAAAGEHLLRSLGMDAEASVVRHHHERIDGRGYPDMLAGDEIPLESRIILTVDAYDAMTAERPYRDRVGGDEALAELRAHAGAQFDSRCVGALARVVRRSGSDRPLDEVDDVRGGTSGGEDLGYAKLFQFRNVVRRDRAADRDDHVLGALLPEQLDDFRNKRHVRARKNRKADRVGVLLDHRLGDLLGRLM